MIIRGRSLSGDLTLETEILVIGSGPGGSTAAMILAEAGHQVTVLEAGPFVEASQLNQREKEMMGLLFQEGGTRMSSDKGITILHGEVLGGTSVINHLICFRTPDRLLELWAQQGIDDLTPDVMKRRFDRIWQILNVTQIGPDDLNLNNALLKKGAESLGWEGACFERNAWNCLGSGFCTIGCAYNAKQSAALTMIPLACQHGATVYSDAVVTHILHDGKTAIGVEGFLRGADRQPKGKLSVKAKIVIVAGGAICTPALLLRSKVPDESKMIGKNLYLHPATPVVGYFPGQNVNPYVGILQGYHISKFSWSLSGHELDVLPEGVAGPPGVASIVVPGLGEQHREYMKMIQEAAIAGVLLRDHHSGQVSIDAQGRPIVDWSLHPEDALRLREGSKRTMEAYFAAGASACLSAHSKPVFITDPGRIDDLDQASYDAGAVTLISYHQMGTATMGHDPKRHATNPDGRLWGLDNLYVSDASLFPTATGVNPQISVYGMAMRVAERLVQRLN